MRTKFGTSVKPQEHPASASCGLLGVIREVTFREEIYTDGLRVIASVRATCEHPSGRPIPYREGVALAKKFRQVAIPHELEFDCSTVELLTSPHWTEWEIEDWRLANVPHCVYLSKTKSNEPKRSYRRQEAHSRKYSEYALKCSVPYCDDVLTPNEPPTAGGGNGGAQPKGTK